MAFCEDLLSQRVGERIVALVKTTGRAVARTVVDELDLVSIEAFPSQEGGPGKTFILEAQVGVDEEEESEEEILESDEEEDEDGSLY